MAGVNILFRTDKVIPGNLVEKPKFYTHEKNTNNFILVPDNLLSFHW